MAPLCECPLVFPSLHPLLHSSGSSADSLYDNHNLLQSGRGTGGSFIQTSFYSL